MLSHADRTGPLLPLFFLAHGLRQVLAMRCRVYELRNKERISVAAASKLLARATPARRAGFAAVYSAARQTLIPLGCQ